MVHLNGNEKLYLWHELLRHLGLFVFYSFGALLFFELTNSIVATLAIGTIYFSAGIISRSVFVPLFSYIKDRIGIISCMGIGLAIVAVSNALVFFMGHYAEITVVGLSIIMVIASWGSGLYWLFSNIIKLNSIGNSKQPASYSSYLTIARMFAAILSTLIGIVLSFQNAFLVLLGLSSVILFFSLVPLSKMKDIDHKESFAFKHMFTRISPLGLIANVRVVAEIFNYGIPLFFLISYQSVPKSVLLTGASYIIAMVLSYYVGKFKDSNNHTLVRIASVIVVSGFVILTQVSSVILLVVIVSILNVCAKAINVAATARLGQEMAASKNKIESMAGIEVARNVGSAAGVLLFLIVFSVYGTIPQWSLGFGALVVIPGIIYACGEYTHKKPKTALYS